MENGARGGQAPSGQSTNRKGHGRVASYWDKGPAEVNGVVEELLAGR